MGAIAGPEDRTVGIEMPRSAPWSVEIGTNGESRTGAGTEMFPPWSVTIGTKVRGAAIAGPVPVGVAGLVGGLTVVVKPRDGRAVVVVGLETGTVADRVEDPDRLIAMTAHQRGNVFVGDCTGNRREVQPATLQSFWHGRHWACSASFSMAEAKLPRVLKGLVLCLDARVTFVARPSAPNNLGYPPFASVDTFDPFRDCLA